MFGTISLWTPVIGDQNETETFRREFAGEEWVGRDPIIVLHTEERFIEVLERMQELGLSMMDVVVRLRGNPSSEVKEAILESEAVWGKRLPA